MSVEANPVALADVTQAEIDAATIRALLNAIGVYQMQQKQDRRRLPVDERMSLSTIYERAERSWAPLERLEATPPQGAVSIPREATAEMMEVGAKVRIAPSFDHDRTPWLRPGDAKDVWRAMYDAALSVAPSAQEVGEKRCASCGFPWGQNPHYHASFCDDRRLADPPSPADVAALVERLRARTPTNFAAGPVVIEAADLIEHLTKGGAA